MQPSERTLVGSVASESKADSSSNGAEETALKSESATSGSAHDVNTGMSTASGRRPSVGMLVMTGCACGPWSGVITRALVHPVDTLRVLQTIPTVAPDAVTATASSESWFWQR